MTYAIKEIFLSLQGEGARVGRVAVFLRCAGCNLWSGRDADRATAPGSCGAWCDTDFVGSDGPDGGRFASASDLAAAAAATWPGGGQPYVVCTGGEPALQVDDALVSALHARAFEVAVETNGTRALPRGIDWTCVSPKVGAPLAVVAGDELKVVVPQVGLDLDRLAALDFRHRWLQPRDGVAWRAHAAAAVAYCLAHPAWRLSLQAHKTLEIR